MNSTGSAASEMDCLRGFTLWDIYYSEWRVSILQAEWLFMEPNFNPPTMTPFS